MPRLASAIAVAGITDRRVLLWLLRSRMIEERGVQRGEIWLMCSEFFIWVRNGEHFLVRFGERRFPYRIDKPKFKVCHQDGTVILEGYPPIRLKSIRVFAYYFALYGALC
jgi:hypothetical protein